MRSGEVPGLEGLQYSAASSGVPPEEGGYRAADPAKFRQHNEQQMSWQQQQWADQEQHERGPAQEQPQPYPQQSQRGGGGGAAAPPPTSSWSDGGGGGAAADHSRYKLANLPPGERDEAQAAHQRKLRQQAELQASWAEQAAAKAAIRQQGGRPRNW
jgi:hypothetical protein